MGFDRGNHVVRLLLLGALAFAALDARGGELLESSGAEVTVAVVEDVELD